MLYRENAMQVWTPAGRGAWSSGQFRQSGFAWKTITKTYQKFACQGLTSEFTGVLCLNHEFHNARYRSLVVTPHIKCLLKFVAPSSPLLGHAYIKCCAVKVRAGGVVATVGQRRAVDSENVDAFDVGKAYRCRIVYGGWAR